MLACALTACGVSRAPPPSADPDAVPAEDTDAPTPSAPTVDTHAAPDTDRSTPDDTDLPVGATTVRGSLRDPGGAVLTSLRVQFCRDTTCTVGTVDADGYTVANLTPGVGTLQVIAPGEADPPLAPVVLPLEAVADRVRTVDLVVPSLQTWTLLPTRFPVQREVADGVWLTIAPGQIEAPTPLLPAPTHVGAARATDGAPRLDGAPGELVALFYLAPWDHPSRTPLPVRFRNDVGAASGALELWQVSSEAHAWVRVDVLDDDGDGNLQPRTVAGIDRLTPLAILRPPTP